MTLSLRAAAGGKAGAWPLGVASSPPAPAPGADAAAGTPPAEVYQVKPWAAQSFGPRLVYFKSARDSQYDLC
jgi:hypothetical protein